MAQSSNDSFPSAMYIAAAVNVKQRLTSAVKALHDQIEAKVSSGKMSLRSAAHMQDATPLTLGQEWSGYAGMLADNLRRIEVHWLRQGVEDRPLCDGQRSHADGIRCHSRKIPGDTIMRFMKPR
jgi:fumarate hydratase class II